MTHAVSFLILIIAALGAGLMNAVAGGGSFLTFPALVFTGVPSIIANASSTMALIPGSLASAWAYREDFHGAENFPLRPLVGVSIGGGIAGALLLLYTPQRTFDSILPWLMLGATILFTFGRQISQSLKRVIHIGPVTVVVAQFFIAVYGGYFGGAIGILMLAVWTVFGLTDLHVIAANRTVLGATMNAVAVVLFIAAHKVWWPQTVAMLIAAIIGGYAGARWAKKVDQRYLRGVITAISICITVMFFLRKH